MSNWSELTRDLLFEIARRMIMYHDLIAFGSVCASWRVAAAAEKSRFKSVPWLLLAPKERNLREFFSPHETLQIMLPEAGNKKYYSSKGWLITIGKDLSMSLLHPFSRIQIQLPHIKTNKNWKENSVNKMYAKFIGKCLLSASPLSKDCIVMVIYGDIGRLAYCRPGDESWTTIDVWQGAYFDITYYNRRFYGINGLGNIMRLDIPARDGDDHHQMVGKEVAHMPNEFFKENFENLYILESAGSLMVVSRQGVQSGKTLRFCVFEVDIRTNTWTEVKSLGNRAIFVGYNSSFSLEASVDISPGCLYFTDDFPDFYSQTREGGGKDMGIYNMQDGSIKQYFTGNSCHHINPPMWVQRC